MQKLSELVDVEQCVEKLQSALSYLDASHKKSSSSRNTLPKSISSYQQQTNSANTNKFSDAKNFQIYDDVPLSHNQENQTSMFQKANAKPQSYFGNQANQNGTKDPSKNAPTAKPKLSKIQKSEIADYEECYPGFSAANNDSDDESLPSSSKKPKKASYFEKEWEKVKKIMN